MTFFLNHPKLHEIRIVAVQNHTSNTISSSTEADVLYTDCFQTQLNTTFRNITLSYFNADEVFATARSLCVSNNVCNATKHIGYIGVKINDNYDLINASNHELHYVQDGGWWSPRYCRRNKTVAIVIPFRDRLDHLAVLLRHLHPILRRQQLHYRIFVIQQDKEYTFNRGKLVNVGVREALKLYPFNCIVIHDVDLIPEDDRIDYSCSRSPLQLAMAIDKFNYQKIYEAHFGGVSSMTTRHYIMVNGFSNSIWNWGGEDDALSFRLNANGLKKINENITTARYTMLKHDDKQKAQTKKEEKETDRAFHYSISHRHTDGYNSVVYRVNEIRAEPLYTLIDVNLMRIAQ